MFYVKLAKFTLISIFLVGTIACFSESSLKNNVSVVLNGGIRKMMDAREEKLTEILTSSGFFVEEVRLLPKPSLMKMTEKVYFDQFVRSASQIRFAVYDDAVVDPYSTPARYLNFSIDEKQVVGFYILDDLVTLLQPGEKWYESDGLKVGKVLLLSKHSFAIVDLALKHAKEYKSAAWDRKFSSGVR